MAKMDKKILDELIRFNNLSHNADNLNEAADIANLGMGSHVERLAKRFNIDMTEQEDVEAGEEDLEIPTDPEAALDELPAEDEGAVEDEEVAIEMEPFLIELRLLIMVPTRQHLLLLSKLMRSICCIKQPVIMLN